MKYESTALIIMCKAPLPGYAKTRLAHHIGQEKAIDFYKACIKDCLQAGVDSGMPVYVFYARPADMEDYSGSDENPAEILGLSPQPGGQIIYCLQENGDLGQRMRLAALKVLNDHPSVIIIGADTPDMSPGILCEASRNIGPKTVVIGPAADGGYYLIGISCAPPQLFSNIEWGGPQVLAQTISACDSLGVDWVLLKEYRDVDDYEDLLDLLARLPDIAAAGLAVHVREWCKKGRATLKEQ